MAASLITADHTVMGGVPCIAGTRIPVATIIGRMAMGSSDEEILADYPTVTREDLLACLAYAARAVDMREIPLRISA